MEGSDGYGWGQPRPPSTARPTASRPNVRGKASPSVPQNTNIPYPGLRSFLQSRGLVPSNGGYASGSRPSSSARERPQAEQPGERAASHSQATSSGAMMGGTIQGSRPRTPGQDATKIAASIYLAKSSTATAGARRTSARNPSPGGYASRPASGPDAAGGTARRAASAPRSGSVDKQRMATTGGMGMGGGVLTDQMNRTWGQAQAPAQLSTALGFLQYRGSTGPAKPQPKVSTAWGSRPSTREDAESRVAGLSGTSRQGYHGGGGGIALEEPYVTAHVDQSRAKLEGSAALKAALEVKKPSDSLFMENSGTPAAQPQQIQGPRIVSGGPVAVGSLTAGIRPRPPSAARQRDGYAAAPRQHHRGSLLLSAPPPDTGADSPAAQRPADDYSSERFSPGMRNGAGQGAGAPRGAFGDEPSAHVTITSARAAAAARETASNNQSRISIGGSKDPGPSSTSAQRAAGPAGGAARPSTPQRAASQVDPAAMSAAPRSYASGLAAPMRTNSMQGGTMALVMRGAGMPEPAGIAPTAAAGPPPRYDDGPATPSSTSSASARRQGSAGRGMEVPPGGAAAATSPHLQPSAAPQTVNPQLVRNGSAVSGTSTASIVPTPVATQGHRPTSAAAVPAAAAAAAAAAASSAAAARTASNQLVTYTSRGDASRTDSSGPGGAAPSAQGSRPSTSSSTVGGYTIGRVLGEGGFCQVRQAVHHISGVKVAIKVVDKVKLTGPNDRKRMAREIAVMKRLSHGHIIRCLDVIESTNRTYIVMEYATSGSLLDFVRSRKRLGEGEACVFLQQMASGLLYCHLNNVIHRDVKLENVLLDANNLVKIIDFGLCAIAAPGTRLKVFCGSPSYAAPEIVSRRPYDGPPVDVWSLGVVLFAMVCGFLPFHAQGDKKALCRKIIKGQYTIPDHVSPDLQDLLRRMLTLEPTERIGMSHVLQHPWVLRYPSNKVRPPTAEAFTGFHHNGSGGNGITGAPINGFVYHARPAFLGTEDSESAEAEAEKGGSGAANGAGTTASSPHAAGNGTSGGGGSTRAFRDEVQDQDLNEGGSGWAVQSATSASDSNTYGGASGGAGGAKSGSGAGSLLGLNGGSMEPRSTRVKSAARKALATVGPTEGGRQAIVTDSGVTLVLNEQALARVIQHGNSREAVIEALIADERNSLTSAYFLLLQSVS